MPDSDDFSKMWALLMMIFLAPFLGECLSLSTPVSLLVDPWTFLAIIMIYGAGAVIIREISCRWAVHTSFFLVALWLGFAFAVFIEGAVFWTLVNPHWSQIELSFFEGYGLFGGILWGWTSYMLVFHVLFTFSGSIYLVSRSFPHIASKPWVSKSCLSVFTGIFLLGSSLWWWRYKDGLLPSFSVIHLILVLLSVGVILGGGFLIVKRRTQIKISSNRSDAFLSRNGITSTRSILSKTLKSVLHIFRGFIWGIGFLLLSQLSAYLKWPFFIHILIILAYLTGFIGITRMIESPRTQTFQSGLPSLSFRWMGLFLSQVVWMLLMADFFSEIAYSITAVVFLSLFVFKWR